MEGNQEANGGLEEMKILKGFPWEQTLMLIYKKGIHGRVVGLIMSMIESQGIELRGLNLRYVTNQFMVEHYNLDSLDQKIPAGKNSGEATDAAVVAILWEGVDVVARVRNIFPLLEDVAESEWLFVDRQGSPVFIEWDTVHTSESVESAQREIKLWFDLDRMEDPNKYRPERPPDEDGSSSEEDETESLTYHCPLNELAIIFINSYAVEHGLVGEIIDALEYANFTLKALKYVEKPSVDVSGEARAVIATIWQHTDIIYHIQKMMAAHDNDIFASWIFHKSWTRLSSEHIHYSDSVPTNEVIKKDFEINYVEPWWGYEEEAYE